MVEDTVDIMLLALNIANVTLDLEAISVRDQELKV